MRRHLTTAATLTLAALTATACTSESADPTVVDQVTAIEGIVDTFTSSWTWKGALDVELEDRHVDALVAAELVGAGPDANAALSEKNLRLALDEMEREHMHGALGDDQSFLTAWNRDGHDLVQVRIDGGEVFAAKTLTPQAAILLTVDPPRLLQLFDDLDAPAPPVEIDRLRQDVREDSFLDADARAVALALLDGEAAGLAGVLDLTWFGVTEDDLDEVREGFAEELIGLADGARAAELFADAITIGDITHAADGSTTASVDVHPREAVFAAYDLFDDAQALAEDGVGWVEDEDLPDTFSDVAALTFDPAGHLVEVRTDVLALARQIGPLAAPPGDPMLRALDALDGARADVVFTFGEVGQVDTVMVEPGATLPWQTVRDLFFGDLIEDFGG